jgi:hypothetical protein
VQADQDKAIDATVLDNQLIVVLADGRELTASLARFPRLMKASERQRLNWRLIGGGDGIHWRDIDEDISVASLLRMS